MPQNSALKKDSELRERYEKERLASDSFQLGRNLSDVAENRVEKWGEEVEEGKEGGERGFNQEEAANTLAGDRERERMEKDEQEGKEGKEGEEGGGEEEIMEKKEKITIPGEVSAIVLQWEFTFALAGPFFLFILLAEFIALKIFSMFKFSKWKKICTLGNFFLACFTTLIYFLLFMMLMAALQKTGGTKTGIAWFGFKVLASNAWSGFTSFFGF